MLWNFNHVSEHWNQSYKPKFEHFNQTQYLKKDRDNKKLDCISTNSMECCGGRQGDLGELGAYTKRRI